MCLGGDVTEILFAFKWASDFIDKRYPDDIEHPDSTCTASAKLLLFAAVEGTIDPTRLASHTGFPIEFILAIAWNMRNNKLWTADGYHSSRWLPPTGELDESEFWDDVAAGLGILWYDGAESLTSVAADKLYRRTVSDRAQTLAARRE
jgi:hypothetical protein